MPIRGSTGISISDATATVGDVYNGKTAYVNTGKITGTMPASEVACLLHFNGEDASTTFTDETGKTWIAGGTAQLDTAQYVFGSASLLLDGNSDYITTADSTDFDFANTDFTISFRVKFTDKTRLQAIYCQGENSTPGNKIIVIWSGTALCYWAMEGGVWKGDFNSAMTVVNNVWYHMIVARRGPHVYFFKNGIIHTTTKVTALSAIKNMSANIYIGATMLGDFSGDYLGGWIDEFMIVKNDKSGNIYPSSAFVQNIVYSYAPLSGTYGYITCGTNGNDIRSTYQYDYNVSFIRKEDHVCFANVTGAMSGFVVGGKMYTAYAPGGTTGYAFEYFNGWSFKASVSSNQSYSGSGTDGTSGWLLAGTMQSGVDGTYVRKYTPSTNTWANQTDITYGRKKCGGKEIGTKIYVVAATLNQEYNTVNQATVRKTDYPTATVYASGCFSYNNKLYLHGGDNNAGTYIKKSYEYVVDSYVEKTDMLATRTSLYQSKMSDINGNGYSIGGNTGSYLDIVDKYNIAGNAWSNIATLPATRSYAIAHSL